MEIRQHDYSEQSNNSIILFPCPQTLYCATAYDDSFDDEDYDYDDDYDDSYDDDEEEEYDYEDEDYNDFRDSYEEYIEENEQEESYRTSLNDIGSLNFGDDDYGECR